MVKEGYAYGLPLVLIAGGLVGFRLYVPASLFLVVALLVLNFFRDPERAVPSEPDLLVSPADGRVVEIRDETWQGRPVRRLSIFMSPLDVHVNRAPIAGRVEEVAHQPGRFHIASQPRASAENEQNVFTLTGEQGRVVVKQIAGVLARRIVFWKHRGDALERGERVGMIKFGSRVDVLAELDVNWQVQVGDRVRAGESVLGARRPSIPSAEPESSG